MVEILRILFAQFLDPVLLRLVYELPEALDGRCHLISVRASLIDRMGDDGDYEKNREYLEVDSKVFVRGRVSEEDEKASKLICEKVIPFERTKRELWIQFPDKAAFLDEEQIVYGYLADSEGEDEVVIYCAKERAVKRLPRNRNIRINQQVLSRLMNHYGESRVKVVEKVIENHF